MESNHTYDTPPEQAPAETLSDAEVWARIEAINPEALASKLTELLSDENIRRGRRSDTHRYKVDIRKVSSENDRKNIDTLLADAEQRAENILKQAADGEGEYARLKFEINGAKARKKDTKELEKKMTKLRQDLAPLQAQYDAVCSEIDWLQGGSTQLSTLVKEQEVYVAHEAPTWEANAEYKAALGQVALAWDRLNKLPPLLPVPVAPPEMAPQDPLPLTLDGQIETPRQLFEIDIQNLIEQTQQADVTEESIQMEAESQPVQRSYGELLANLHATKINVSARLQSTVNELMNEDASV
jgi:hypothetical protein